MEKMKVVLVDVDGTIAKIDHRLYLVKKTPKDWEGFYDASVKDEPLTENIKMIKEDMAKLEATPVFVTGRSAVIRNQTAKWIYEHFFGLDKEDPSEDFLRHLFMRKEGDHREDHVVKKEIFDLHLVSYDILRAYEDRPRVVRMYRGLGLDVVDLGPGYEF